MKTSAERSPVSAESNPHENDRLSYDLIVYVFGCMPNPGDTVLLDQIAEDLEESPDMILAAAEELRLDGLLDISCNEGVITVLKKDEKFLKEQMAYNSIRR